MSFFPGCSMKNAVVLKIWGTMNNRSYTLIICIFLYVHDWNNVWGRNNAIIIFPSLSLFRNWTNHLTPFFFCLSIWVSQCQDKSIYLHYHANSSEYIVIPSFEMFHFCYSLSQCQLGFFLSLSCGKKGFYTDIEKKSFLNLSLCLKRNIFIYIYFKFGYKIFARFFILCFFPSTANLPFILYM